MQVNLNGEVLKVVKSAYRDGVPCLRLVDSDGMPYATATVHLDGLTLGDNQTLIKDYSENFGMLAALVNAGVVRPTTLFVESGFVTIPVVDVLI